MTVRKQKVNNKAKKLKKEVYTISEDYYEAKLLILYQYIDKLADIIIYNTDSRYEASVITLMSENVEKSLEALNKKFKKI